MRTALRRRITLGLVEHLPLDDLHDTLVVDIPALDPELLAVLALEVTLAHFDDPTRPDPRNDAWCPRGHLAALEDEPSRAEGRRRLERAREDVGGDDMGRVGGGEAEVVREGDVGERRAVGPPQDVSASARRSSGERGERGTRLNWWSCSEKWTIVAPSCLVRGSVAAKCRGGLCLSRRVFGRRRAWRHFLATWC